MTFIDNVVDAHLAAWDALHPQAPCGGRAYFVTNGDPRPVAEVINAILAAAGVAPVTRFAPVPLAWTAAALSEGFARLFHPDREPMLTRYLVDQLSTAHWFRIDAARRDLGWTPRVGFQEGLGRLKAWFDAAGAAPGEGRHRGKNRWDRGGSEGWDGTHPPRPPPAFPVRATSPPPTPLVTRACVRITRGEGGGLPGGSIQAQFEEHLLVLEPAPIPVGRQAPIGRLEGTAEPGAPSGRLTKSTVQRILWHEV